LSVCHGIITEHGGRICAKSKPGKGTIFLIELPIPTKITARVQPKAETQALAKE
jgi:signal transduction histidine kinase